MKNYVGFLLFFIIFSVSAWSDVISFGFNDVDLDGELNELNIQAKIDTDKFALQVSSHWGVSTKQVSFAISQGLEPSEVYVAAFIAKYSNKNLESVINLYFDNKKAGWGALARSLGIKPGSKAFKELKEKSKMPRNKTKKNKKQQN
jgi:hypothetical protein